MIERARRGEFESLVSELRRGVEAIINNDESREISVESFKAGLSNDE